MKYNVTNVKIRLKNIQKWLVNGLQETAQPIINFILCSLVLVTPPLVRDNTTLRVASWKQRIQFYPLANTLANVAVQKSSIYM